MEQQLLNNFIEAFKNLQAQVANGEKPEGELFALSKAFFTATGGKLSHYNSPLAVGVAVVPVIKDGETGFLAFKRGINPFIGGVAFPGGFVDANEGSKEAAIRELMEETNLSRPDESMWKHIGEKKTPANQLLIFYAYKQPIDWAVIEEAYNGLVDKSESQGIVFLQRDTEMCFSLHSEIRDEQFAILDALTNQDKRKPKP